MPTITTFAQAQDALRPFYDNARTLYTLDAMRELMNFLNNPQNKLKILHVAGTSGKTSTAYYSAALLRTAGMSVGLSVSPHVDNVNERLQINGQPLPEAEFGQVLSEFLEVIKDCAIKPSYFELLTAMAFWEFARRQLDYAVMEVGLGGLLDATNVIDRPDKVCLITDIGLDHTQILGDTLGAIAAQKAGIIQTGNVVLMYEQGPEVMAVIEPIAAEQQARLTELSVGAAVTLPDLPLFQQHNLGLAVAAVNYVNERDGRPLLAADQIRQAAQTVVPARLERFRINGKTVIIDGSHNQQKLHALFDSLQELYPGQSVAALAAFVSGNGSRWQAGLTELLPRLEHLILTSFYSEKDLPKASVDPNELAVFCHIQNFGDITVTPDPATAFNELLQRPEPILLVTGSFYLLNHIRPLVVDLV